MSSKAPSAVWTKEKEKQWTKYQKHRLEELFELYDPNERGHIPKVSLKLYYLIRPNISRFNLPL